MQAKVFSQDRPKLIVLTGATGVGKTIAAIALAEQLHCPIISADSRQIYKETRIGTASPTNEELARVRHYFIGSRSIHDPDYSAADYATDASILLEELFQRFPHLILSGGSMLYVDALINGLDAIPIVPNDVRINLAKDYETNGLEALRAELRRVDPNYLERIDPNNYKRILRALEVFRYTGKPFSSFHRKQKKQQFYDIVHIELERPRSELFDRINSRVYSMVEAGLEAEARALYPWRSLNALDTVGYKEMFMYIDGIYTFDEAIRQIQRNSRIYARRQQTYWRHKPEIIHTDLSKQTSLINLV